MLTRCPTWRCVWLPAVLLPLLVLGACLPVPLGDPEKSAVEDRFVGAWSWDTNDARHMVVVRPWDARTYYVRLVTFSHEPGRKKADSQVLKGWLTTVKGEVFATLQDAEALATLPGEDHERIFLVARLNLVDDRLIATPLNPSFPPFEVARSPEELEALIAQHMENPDMWGAEALTLRKLDSQQRREFEALFERAFERNAAQ